MSADCNPDQLSPEDFPGWTFQIFTTSELSVIDLDYEPVPWLVSVTGIRATRGRTRLLAYDYDPRGAWRLIVEAIIARGSPG